MAEGIQRLWLVRHGVTSWNSTQRMCGVSDIALSETGRVQARWLARRLQREQIATIYSSDLLRAKETAEIIARSQPASVHYVLSPAWRELNFGAWEGLTYTQIAEQFPGQLDFFSDPEHVSPPNGESLAEVLQRIQPVLSTFLQAHAVDKGDIVLVSHAGLLRALLCRVLTIPLTQQWRLQIAPGSLSLLHLLTPLEKDGFPTGILSLLNEQRPKRLTK